MCIVHVMDIIGYGTLTSCATRRSHTCTESDKKRERKRVGKKMRNQQEKAFMKPLRTQNLPFFFIL